MALRALARVAVRRASVLRVSALLPPQRFFSASPNVEEQRFLEALKENQRLYPEDFQLLANSHGELARYYSEHNKQDLVLQHCKQQFELLQKVRPEPWTELFDVGRLVVELFYSESRFEDCETVALQLVTMARNAHGDSHLELARAHFMIAHLKELLGKTQEAEQACQASIEIVKQHQEPEFLAALFQNLANLRKSVQDFTAAERHIEESLRLLGGSKSPAKDELLASANSAKGEIFAIQGKFAEAEDLFKGALSARQSAKQPNKVEIANCLNNLGMVYLNTNRIEDAERTFKEKMTIDKTVFPEQHPAIANSYHNLAAVDEAKGDFKSAKQNFLKALEIRKSTLGNAHQHIAMVHQNLVGLCLALREIDDADKHAKQAVDVGRQVYDEDHPFMGTAFFDLGTVQDIRGQLQEALQSHLKSLEIRSKSLPSTHPHIGSSYLSLGQAYKKLNELEKANEFYSKGYEMMKQQLRDDNPDLATILNNMGSINYSRGNLAGAEEDIRKSLELRLRTSDDLNPTVVTTRGNLAAVLLASKKFEPAEKELVKCLQAVEARPGETGVTPETVAKLLHTALQGQYKYKDALALAKKYNFDN